MNNFDTPYSEYKSSNPLYTRWECDYKYDKNKDDANNRPKAYIKGYNHQEAISKGN